MCRILLLLLAVAVLPRTTAAQQVTLRTVLQHIPGADRVTADIQPTDTLYDAKNQYLAYRFNNDGEQVKLVEARLYGKPGGKQLLTVTKYSGDMQCMYYYTSFFEWDPKTDSVMPRKASICLPALNINQFFNDSSIYRLAAKYLAPTRAAYLGDSATIDQMLHEIYSIRFYPDPKKQVMYVTLNVCDYIPRNEVGIPEADWIRFEKAFHSRRMIYNAAKLRFELR
jgi:hypothetical protein